MATALARLVGKPRTGLAGFLLLMLVGCTPPSAQVDLTGQINVFGPAAEISLSNLADDWVALGADPEDHAEITATADGPSMRVSGGPKPYALVRRVDASLLATPFLSWSWRVEAVDRAIHPARMTIGIRDNPERRGGWRPPVGLGASRGLPEFDRTITIAWGNSALNRGSWKNMMSESTATASVRYVVRGGRENAGRWWRETIDLGEIHALAWPGLDRAESRIVFIGITVTANPTAASADFAAIKLSR